MNDTVVISTIGACTPIGRDAWASAAAVRAKISGASQHPFMIDELGEPVLVACAPWLDPELMGQARIEALIFPAIDQVLDGIELVGGGRFRIALALGLSGLRDGVPGASPDRLTEAIMSRYAGVFSATACFSSGHAAGLAAMNASCRAIRDGKIDACVVAGVESYIDPFTLKRVETKDQLHGGGPMRNPWGFVPGEAAGALLIMRDSIAQKFALPTVGSVLGGGGAFEANQIRTETVCIGSGLTQALQGALKALPRNTKVSDVYCDLNGEPYRSDEYGFASLRLGEYFESASGFVAPADCWGDVSAAGGPLHMVLAVIAGIKGYANGSLAVVWASGEGGERVAVLIKTNGERAQCL